MPTRRYQYMLAPYHLTQNRGLASDSISICLTQASHAFPYLDLRTFIGASLHGFAYNQHSPPQIAHCPLQDPIVLARWVKIECPCRQRQNNLRLCSAVTHLNGRTSRYAKVDPMQSLGLFEKGIYPRGAASAERNLSGRNSSAVSPHTDLS
jgi:hypothetical protein